MNTFQRHYQSMANFMRNKSNTGRLGHSLESTYAETIDVPSPDNRVVIETLVPSDTPTNVKTATWVDTVPDVTTSDNVADLQAALDTYTIEDEIGELNHIYERNEDKMAQLEEIRTQVITHWEDPSMQQAVISMGIGAESYFRPYAGRKVPLAVAMEAIDAKMAALGAAGLAALFALFWKIWTLIKARSGKGGGSDKAQSVADSNIKSGNEAIQKFAPVANTYIKTEVLEEIFDDKDGPEKFMESNKDKVQVLAKDFAEAYLTEVIYPKAATNKWIHYSLRDASAINNATKKLNACIGELPALLAVVKAYIEELEKVTDLSEKYDEHVDARFKDKKSALNKLIQHQKDLDEIKAEVNKLPTPDKAAKFDISYSALVKIVNAYERITAPSDEVMDDLKDIDKTITKLRESVESLGKEDRKKAAQKLLDEVNKYFIAYKNIQEIANEIGGGRVLLSASYAKFGKVLSKATTLASKSSSDD